MTTLTVTGPMVTDRPVLPASVPGFYLRHRQGGFVAHITASEAAFSTVRGLTALVPVAYGADQDTADTATWVVSSCSATQCAPAVITCRWS